MSCGKRPLEVDAPILGEIVAITVHGRLDKMAVAVGPLIRLRAPRGARLESLLED